MWDERYRSGEFVYGREPNDFLAAFAGRIPGGRVLCLAEGQGRNAVYLAGLGYQVTGVDSSAVGLEMARKLAAEKGVEIETINADLESFVIGENCWEGIVSIFCHLPPPVRKVLHRKVVAGLRPGGIFILEAYTPRQLEFRTGGPTSPDLLMTLDALRSELQGLDFIHAAEVERDVIEGTLHTGKASVVQVAAVKP